MDVYQLGMQKINNMKFIIYFYQFKGKFIDLYNYFNILNITNTFVILNISLPHRGLIPDGVVKF